MIDGSVVVSEIVVEVVVSEVVVGVIVSVAVVEVVVVAEDEELWRER